MKIVHYATSLSRSAGGLYYSVSGLAQGLADLGADITVIGGADRHFAEDRAVWGDVPVRPFPFRFGRYGLDPGILRELARLKPDILHIHGIWSAASAYGRLAVARGIDVIVSSHGMLDPWILARRPRLKALHAWLFERPMLTKAHLHALNQAEREAALAYMPDLARRTFVVPNGISAADDADTAGVRSGMLYLGRLHEKKQVLELIRAWAAVPGLRKERLTIAGWGEKAYETEVAVLAASTPGVFFVGALYGEAKAAALRSAAFLVLPSLSEGLPMAVLEALQFGAIPLITAQCNLPELFAHDIALPISSDFRDFPDIATAAFAMSPTEKAERATSARAYAKRYLWTDVARQMLDHYRRIREARP
ncbi:glycosyltransferase [Devosia geojensis]|uniref:glycosyltransferase n=1 Tax=Devosia geojensis TaxID=443610 RepID=UPI0006976E8D|nr:glycosyltransferase [Devosia geojensis]